MFTRKADRRWFSAPRWCVAVLLLLGGAAAAYAQFGGGKGPATAKPTVPPAEAPAAEQRLFPNGLPKIESMLKSALEHHPEILAARSKLRAAEAEQRQAELKALKDVMDVRDRWEKASRAADPGNLGANHPAVREHLANLAAIEWELAFLLGTRGELRAGSEPAVEQGRPAPQATIPVAPILIESVIPRGDQANAIKKQLGTQISVNLEDTPLTEVVAYLSEQSGLRFILDKQEFEDEGFPVDSPITLKLGDTELGAVLQALEDLHKPLYFVVRDYGIFATTETNRSSEAVSARDFWKLTDEELRDKLRQQRQEEMGGMGGMGGGGGFF